MKTTILALFFVFLGLNSNSLRANDICKESMSEHLQIIDSSEAYLKTLNEHSKEISAFEITQMQKSMTKRYNSLKSLLALYDDEKMGCTPKLLSTAVAIYDFSKVGQSILANKVLRRVFLGFVKFPLYKLSDYISNYKNYTSNNLIQKVENEIDVSKLELPSGVIFHTSELEYDPNLYALSDLAVKGSTSIVAGVAKILGFISDHVSWRQGRIKNNQEAIRTLQENLKPLDLIYERREFRLSSYTIPGHFGHVGVWLGTKQELIALGIWDKKYFAPFRDYVEAGKNILEIRKEGINFQGIETFINLDEIAVTRVKNITERADFVYEELSEQIGKSYDFKFDARTEDKITCAELIAFSYGDIKWPQTKTLFQISLRPDDLAVLTLDPNSPAEFVLYLKGIKAKKGGGFENMSFDQWSKLFKVGDYLSSAEIIASDEINNEDEY